MCIYRCSGCIKNRNPEDSLFRLSEDGCTEQSALPGCHPEAKKVFQKIDDDGSTWRNMTTPISPPPYKNPWKLPITQQGDV